MTQLYLWASCPFCKKVLQAADAMGLKEGTHFEVVEAAPGTPGRAKVEEVGGKAMVPFLIDNEISMYESDDIIQYLKKKLP